MVVPLVACGEEVAPQKQYGEEVGTEIEGLETGEEGDSSSSSTPVYDVNNLSSCTTKPTLVNYSVNSYYHDLLSDRLINSYDEILDAYSKFSDSIILTKKITPEELFQIMTIIYLDEPKYFQVSSKYSYTLDASGYVANINLEYLMPQITYRQQLAQLEQFFSKIYSDEYYKSLENEENVSDVYSLENSINTSILSNTAIKSLLGYCANNSLISTDDADNTASSLIIDEKITSASVAKVFNFGCRYIGINSTVKIGNLTNYDAQTELQSTAEPSITSIAQYQNVTTQSGDGTVTYTVDYNYNDYYMWNVIEFNDDWYNVDILYSTFLKRKRVLHDATYSQKIQELQQLFTPSLDDLTLVNVSDYMISESRMSYYTDDVLGTAPSCTTNEFLNSYRKGTYLLPHTESQVMTLLNNKISVLRTSKAPSMWFQFEDEESLTYFINNLDSTITNFNSETNNLISGYDVYSDRQNLTVEVYNITYKR